MATMDEILISPNSTEFHETRNTSVDFMALESNGFSLNEKCILTALISLVIIFTTGGNLLTILCVIRDKSLHSVSYAYIASLALADFIVGSIVMPFSMFYMITFDGVWIFGSVICDLWQFMDYVGCTASLTNLCAIALDRYQTVSKPFKAIRKRTKGRVALTLLITWLLPIFHWVVFFSILRSINGFPPPSTCSLEWRPQFLVIMASTIIIYIPVITTLVFFVMIFVSLRRHATRLTKRLCRRSFQFETSVNESSVPFIENRTSPGSDVSAGSATAPPVNVKKQTPCCEMMCSGKKRHVSRDSNENEFILEKADSDVEDEVFMFIFCDTRWEYVTYRTVGTNTPSQWKMTRSCKDVATNTCPATMGNDNTVSLVRSRSEPSFCLEISYVQKCLKPRLVPTPACDITRSNSDEAHPLRGEWPEVLKNKPETKTESSTTEKSRVSGQSDRLRRRRLASVEKVRLAQQINAARNLAVLMGFLLLCWMPFAIMWPIHTYCPECLTTKVYNLSFWINYLNSSMNPIIYCLCNPNIRNAFRRFLFRQ